MRFTWQIHTIFFAYKHSSIFLFMSMSFHCDSSSHSSDPLFYLTKQVRGQQIHSNKALNAVLLFHVRQGDKKPSQCWGDENFPLTDPGMTIWAVWDCKDNNWAGTSVEKPVIWEPWLPSQLLQKWKLSINTLHRDRQWTWQVFSYLQIKVNLSSVSLKQSIN